MTAPGTPFSHRQRQQAARLLLVSAAGPVAYFAVRPFVGSDTAGLAIAGVVPIAYTIAFALLRRRIDLWGLLNAIGYALACIVSLLAGGSSLPVKLPEASATFLVGMVLLGTVLARRPLPVGRLLRVPHADQRLNATLSAMVGAFLVLHALLTLTLAMTLPTATYLVAGRAVNWATIAAGALSLYGYLLRLRRRGPAGPAGPVGHVPDGIRRGLPEQQPRKEHPPAAGDENLLPLVSKTGIVHEHGTMGARYAMNCHCTKCNAYGREYQRQWRRQQTARRASNGELTKAYIWRRDGSEFLMADVWGRFWNAARKAADLPEDFTPYNARHTGISWAIDKGADLQKVRQRAGHGSLEVTSRYAAILDERDTSLADALEEISGGPRAAECFGQTSAELDAAVDHL